MFKDIKSCWEKVLKTNIRLDDDFFSIGGSSLLAIQIISEIQDVYGVEIGLIDFFENPTIESFARRVEIIIAETRINKFGRDTLTLFNIEEKNNQWYDTTFWQQKVYLKHVFHKHPQIFNSSFEIFFENDIFNSLDTAFSKIIKRHESLRTSFALIDGKVKQKIHELQNYNGIVQFCDLSMENLSESDLNGIQIDHKSTFFNLSTGPIFKATYYKLKEGGLFLFVVHQINFEGSSNSLLQKELFDNLNNLESNPLSIQLKNIPEVVFKKDQLEQSRQYWLNEFNGNFSPIYLSYDKPIPIEKHHSIKYNEAIIRQSYINCHDYLTEIQRELLVGVVPSIKIEPAIRANFTLPDKFVIQLQKKAAEQKISVFTIIVTSLALVLYNMSNQSPYIVMGNIVSYRNKKGINNMIGYLSNYILYKISIDKNMSISDLFSEVKKKIISSHDHCIFPYEKLLEELNQPHEHLNNLLIDFIEVDKDLTFSTSSITFYEANDWAEFDIDINIFKYNNGIYIDCYYNTNLYNKQTIVEFLNNIKNVIMEITSTSNLKVNDFTHDRFQTKTYL